MQVRLDTLAHLARVCVRCLAAICLVAVAPAAPAQQPTPPIVPQVGRWQMTQEVTAAQAASIAALPPQVQARIGYDPVARAITTVACLSPQSIKAWEEAERRLRAAGSAQCDDPVYVASGDDMTMTLECSAPRPLSMRNSYRFNAARDGYTYETETTVTISDRQETRHARGSARRIGGC
ncbi:MAG: DUF3617 family protein [Burkholderiales bacterium]|nr:DUF3617 family protein [Burkholderiales bacterium]